MINTAGLLFLLNSSCSSARWLKDAAPELQNKQNCVPVSMETVASRGRVIFSFNLAVSLPMIPVFSVA